MEFLGHQIGGDVITPSSDNLEKIRKTNHQEASEILCRISWLIQRPHLAPCIFGPPFPAHFFRAPKQALNGATIFAKSNMATSRYVI